LVLRYSGDYELQYLPQDKLLSLFKRHKLSSHDLKLLLRCCSPGRVKHPAILPRPANHCVIFLVEHVKMICFTDQCIILTPDDMKTDRFVESLKNHDRFSLMEQDFEHIVLEKAIESVVEKFRKHLQIIKPALNLLLQEIEEHAETEGLKKLLAVKKSLAQFQQKVHSVIRVINGLLDDPEDIRNMKLRQEEKGDIKEILESFSADMDEIDAEITTFNDMIEDTDHFVSAHLDSVRNEIMKMSLCIEVFALMIGFGALVGSAFGMNLDFDEKIFGDWSFLIVIVFTVVVMLFIGAGFLKKYHQLKKNTSSALTFNLLKNFFTYVDDLEYHLFSRSVTKAEFKDAVEKITNLNISQKESDYLFSMVDANNDGVIDTEEELNLDIRGL